MRRKLRSESVPATAAATVIPSALEFFEYWLHFRPSPYQRVLLKCIFGLPLLDPEEWRIYRRATGRTRYLRRPYAEATIISGARGGKSILAAGICLYKSLFSSLVLKDTDQTPWAVVIAQDRTAAQQVVLKYMKQLIRANPALLARVKDGDAGLQSDKILLDNGWTLGAFSSTDASAQGVRIAVAVLDEVAYMPGAGKENSDVEIVGMVRRGQIGLPDGVKLLVKISTPRGKSGVLYEDFTSYFSKEDPIHLVWKATSIEMNPTDVKLEELEILRQADPVRHARYYMAQFGDDEQAFLAMADIERVVVRGRVEPLPPRTHTIYCAAVDASGGSGRDNFTFCICHREVTPEGQVYVVVDLIRSWNRTGEFFDLNAVVDKIVGLCRQYGIDVLWGDAFSGHLVRDQFGLRGQKYDLPHEIKKQIHGAAPVTWHHGAPLHRSDLYVRMLPFFTLGTIEIPDHPVLVRELQMLERNAGTDKIDHPMGLRDDHCTVVSICCAMLTLNGDRPTPGVRAVHASPVSDYARQTPIAPPPKRGLPTAVGRPIAQALGGQGKMPKPWVRSGGGIDPNRRWR